MRVRNLVLAALPASALKRIPVRSVDLEAGQALKLPPGLEQEVWLPETCVLTAAIEMADGKIAYMDPMGYEGVFITGDLDHVLTPFSWVCRLPGRAWTIEVEAWEELRAREPELRKAIYDSHRIWLGQSLQLNACNRVHSLRARAATMLLLLVNKTGQPTITITHDTLAALLGVQRPAVSLTLHEFAATGLISSGYGRIHLSQARSLLSVACECYGEIMTLISTASSPTRDKPASRAEGLAEQAGVASQLRSR